MKGAFRQILTAAAGVIAAFGFGRSHVDASNSSRVVAVSEAQQRKVRELNADVSGSVLGGLFRNTGTPPDVWGRSRACARMVARNRGIAAGRRRG